jgi:hypothetical protein
VLEQFRVKTAVGARFVAILSGAALIDCGGTVVTHGHELGDDKGAVAASGNGGRPAFGGRGSTFDASVGGSSSGGTADASAGPGDHATMSCTTEAGCSTSTCDDGWANCDKTLPDCETPLGANGPTCFPGYDNSMTIPQLSEGPRYHKSVLAGDGTLFVGGSFVGKVDFDPGPDIDLHDAADTDGGFVSKFGADGKYGWTRVFPNAGDPFVTTMSTGPGGSVVVAGTYAGTVDFDPGTGVDEHPLQGDSDGYVMKLLADGSLAWARTFPGAVGSYGNVDRSAVGQNGGVLVAVSHTGTIDMDPGPAERLDSTGDTAYFLAALTPSGDLVWSHRYPNCMEVKFAALGPDGTARVGGTFLTDCSFGGTQIAHLGVTEDGFVASFAPSGAYKGAMTFAGVDAVVKPTSLTVRQDGSMILGGSFYHKADFDPGPGRAERVATTTESGFLVATTADDAFAWVHTLPGHQIANTTFVANSSVLAIAVNNDDISMRILGFGSDGISRWSLALPHIWSLNSVAADTTGVSVFGLLDGPADLDLGPGTHVVGHDGEGAYFASRYGF